tara:strand:- start:54 stop:215 length:162 start_codon:yes stop_codon:yes gene_type:complete
MKISKLKQHLKEEREERDRLEAMVSALKQKQIDNDDEIKLLIAEIREQEPEFR